MSTDLSTPLSSGGRLQSQQLYAQLMQGFDKSEGQGEECRWRWLMAAHIVGQHYLALHWHNHRAMLRFAFATRDYPEIVGQLFRLSQVPVGHFLGKLPSGNIGRATVSAFKRMEPDQEMRQLITEAREKASAKSRCWTDQELSEPDLLNADTTSSNAPHTMPMSAILNAGQCQPCQWKSRKSTT